MGAEAVELWHADADLKGVDAVIVPGGFSYGDYLRPGAIARFAKVMGPLEEFARDGRTDPWRMQRLPGPDGGASAARRPAPQHAHALRVRPRPCAGRDVDTPWTAGCDPGEELTLPVAHNEGNYFADPETLARLEDEERVVLRYLENPNGAANDIAGVCNEGRNVVGLMPHPERVSDPALGSDEGLRILSSVLVGAGV